MKPAERGLLQRERLREDFADVAWLFLKEELRSGEIALSTIIRHYEGFLKAATLLGNEVPNVRRATLEAVQRAWMNFKSTQALRQLVRSCLVHIFETLISIAGQDDTVDGREMLRILAWLRDDVKIGRTKPGEEYLSESELNAVLQACLTDMASGIAYANTHSDLLAVSLHPNSKENAAVVVQWGVALMILIMAFTGLRRESIVRLKTNDWAEVHSGLYILAWHHNKKVEENVAVLPAVLAQELKTYIEYTAKIRSLLGTEAIFVMSNTQGHWKTLSILHCNYRLRRFVERHGLERGGEPLPLNGTVLRRTYVTRALYEGRNIAALRSQLGHIHLDSTLRYAKFDQYEHPSEVSAPLDEYGRKALSLWHTPLILDDLDPGEREALLGVKVKRRQDVGFCRHNCCVKAAEGSPPPCSLCEHLVTGLEFKNAWETEFHQRKQQLEKLAVEPGSEMMLAQMRFQFEHFKANFTFIQERFRLL